MTEMDKTDDRGHYVFKVNGFDIEVDYRLITARRILELAKVRGAIPDNPDEYALEGDKGRYAPDQSIDLAEENVFYTVRNTPTPVA